MADSNLALVERTDQEDGDRSPNESAWASESCSGGGIDFEALDVSRQLPISHLFPKDRGRLFVASLLADASIEKRDISGIGHVDTAVVKMKSIEEFARLHKHGRDRALRYVAILEALQIVQRSRHAEYTELRIPLVAWAPSAQALSNLDELLVPQEARAKLQQLAGTVKTRFLLLYGSPSAWLTLYDDLQGALADLADQLDHRVSATKRTLLQMRIMKLRLRLAGSEGNCLREGDLKPPPGDQNGRASTQKGDFSPAVSLANGSTPAQKGDFQGRSNQASRPGLAEKGDFPAGPDDTIAPTSAQEGDLKPPPGGQNGSPFAEKGDFPVRPSSQNEYNHAEEGDFQEQSGRHVAQEGDFQEAASRASFNVNVITNDNISEKKDDNVNDADTNQDRYTGKEAKAAGLQLANFLEGGQNIGGFVNKAKQCTPTVIRAAVIDALVHDAFPTIDPDDQRGQPQTLAKWFHLACNSYGKSGMPIPAFVERWLRTDLSWSEIKQQLNEASNKYRWYMNGPGGASLVRKYLCGEIDQPALDKALQLARQNDAPTGARLEIRLDQEARGMDEEPAARSSAPRRLVETPIAVQSSNQAPSDDQAKMDFARRQKPRAIELGIPQPTVQRPHRCGNPLFYSPTTWATPCCAYCGGDTKWPKEIWDLIESIRTYVGPRALEDGRVMAVGAGLPG